MILKSIQVIITNLYNDKLAINLATCNEICPDDSGSRFPICLYGNCYH